MLKKSTPIAWLMARSCWVSMEFLANIFCTVRGCTWIRSASHSLVWFCRRSSSLIVCPMCICIKKNREAFLLALEVLDYLSPIQRSSRFVTRASCFLLGDSKTRNCPDSECYFASINAFFVYCSIAMCLYCLYF